MKIELIQVSGFILQLRLTAEMKNEDAGHYKLENKDIRALHRLLTDGDGHILADIVDIFEQTPDEASATWKRIERLEQRVDSLELSLVAPAPARLPDDGGVRD